MSAPNCARGEPRSGTLLPLHSRSAAGVAAASQLYPVGAQLLPLGGQRCGESPCGPSCRNKPLRALLSCAAASHLGGGAQLLRAGSQRCLRVRRVHCRRAPFALSAVRTAQRVDAPGAARLDGMAGKFIGGERVEVLSREEGFADAWATATVISSSKDGSYKS